MNIYKYKNPGPASDEIERHHLAGIHDIYKKGEIFFKTGTE